MLSSRLAWAHRTAGRSCSAVGGIYAWKGTKWIRRIEFLDHERQGFWERRGYPDTAEPWLDDRYASAGPPSHGAPESPGLATS